RHATRCTEGLALLRRRRLLRNLFFAGLGAGRALGSPAGALGVGGGLRARLVLALALFLGLSPILALFAVRVLSGLLVRSSTRLLNGGVSLYGDPPRFPDCVLLRSGLGRRLLPTGLLGRGRLSRLRLRLLLVGGSLLDLLGLRRAVGEGALGLSGHA